MPHLVTSRLVAGAVFAILAITPAAASYDGTWNVSIVTKSGSCEAAPPVSIQIANGRVVGDPMLGISGHVAEGGGIIVSIKNGLRRAVGAGRLAASAGFGTWRGGPCSGTWTAQRI